MRRYNYTPELVAMYCDDLHHAANITVIHNPLATPGAVPADPDDDKIVACAVAADADYLVTRDAHLISLGAHGRIVMIVPEQFIHLVRAQQYP